MFGWSLAKVERERDQLKALVDEYAKRYIAANDAAWRATKDKERAQEQLDNCKNDGEKLARKYEMLNRRFAEHESQLLSARRANSVYFAAYAEYERILRMRAGYKPQLVVFDAGIYTDTFGYERHAWSVWLDGVRLYTTSIRADNAEQPERLWLTVEALERALGVKRMRAKAKAGFDPEGAGGGPRKLTPTWLPS